MCFSYHTKWDSDNVYTYIICYVIYVTVYPSCTFYILFIAVGTCASEEMSNDPQSYKSEYVRTCFDVNNRGKTIVKDEKGTLTILMCPSN